MKQRRYHIVIASFIFAILVWVSINMADEYAIVKHLPVVLENMREGKALRFPIPKMISVNFRGRGWQLATIYFSTNLKYYVDVSMLGSEVYLITSSDFFEHVKLPMAVQPVDVKPETLVLALADYKEKRVPVIPRLVLNFHEGFGQVGPLHVTPESVVVGGASNLNEAVLRWYTEYRKYDNLRSPINEDLELEELPTFSLEVVPRSVHVQVDVQPFAERTISELPLTVTALPPNREVMFIPPKMDVIVRGGIDELAKLSVSDFQVSVAYQALVLDTMGIVTPVLTAPAGVNIIRHTPERFQFVIRKKL